MGLMSVASCCMKTVLGIVLVLALISVHHLGVEWEKSIVDVDIFTVQDPRFWGPMTMLVPNNCTTLAAMMSRRTNASNASEMWELPTYFGDNPPDTVQTNLLGHPILPTRDVMNLVAVQKCNHTVEVPDVTWSQYYWAAMVTASSGFDIDALHTTRMRFFWGFVIVCLAEFLAQYAQAIQKVTSDGKGDGQSMAQKLAAQVYAKVSGVQLQLTFVSLFITYWHEDHYLMNYFPGRAYVAAMILPCLAFPGAIFMESDNKPGLACVGCCACFIIFFAVFPVYFGWQLYNLQFLYTLFTGEYANEVAFSARFPSIQQTVGHASKHLIGINIVDAVLASAEGIAGREPEVGSDMYGLLDETSEQLPDAELGKPILDQ